MEHPKKILGRVEELSKKIGRLKAELADANAELGTLTEIITIYDEHFAPKVRSVEDRDGGAHQTVR